MRIAIPLAEGLLTMHFGHCEELALIDVDPEQKSILKQETVKAPPHAPGLLPKWLQERGANLVIAGGMGARAQQLFAENQIEVIVGVSSDKPVTVVERYLAGRLVSGPNVCDH